MRRAWAGAGASEMRSASERADQARVTGSERTGDGAVAGRWVPETLKQRGGGGQRGGARGGCLHAGWTDVPQGGSQPG